MQLSQVVPQCDLRPGHTPDDLVKAVLSAIAWYHDIQMHKLIFTKVGDRPNLLVRYSADQPLHFNQVCIGMVAYPVTVKECTTERHIRSPDPMPSAGYPCVPDEWKVAPPQPRRVPQLYVRFEGTGTQTNFLNNMGPDERPPMPNHEIQGILRPRGSTAVRVHWRKPFESTVTFASEAARDAVLRDKTNVEKDFKSWFSANRIPCTGVVLRKSRNANNDNWAGNFGDADYGPSR